MSELDPAAQASAVGKDPKVIKRYTNRKLYDTVESRYVTLDEIAEMVKQGVEVKIVDNRSKDDLTSVTLAQIIFEEEKKKNRMPLKVLREIIRHPGDSISDFIQKEVTPRVASIREEAEQRLDKLLGRADGVEGTDPGTPPAVAGSAATSPDFLKASQRVLEDWQRRIDERVKLVLENVTGNLPALGRDMQTLLNRLESLEKKIDELERKK
jgi:polyhydroxyalkanoate synthesis repressor PhaR